jgi:cytochrome P450
MSTENNPPPTVGTLAEYSRAPFERRTEWAREGDVVRITGDDEDHHMIVHPDYVKEVLLKRDDVVKFDGHESVFGRGMVSVYGDQWRAQRGAVQPMFQPAQIRSYAETIQEIVRGVVGELGDGETFDAREQFTDLTMEVMLQTLFGGESHRKETISRAASRITEWFLETATAGDVPPEVQSGYERGMDELVGMIDEMIEQRRTAPSSSDGLLSLLVELGPDSDANYTDGRIRDEMITMLFGAHETTALTLTYTIYLLAGEQRAERRLLDELETVVETDVPGPSHLDELTYTEQVIDEALRLYSPAHSLFREATAEVELGGYTIPEGDVLYLPQWVIHRDERWWDDPQEFRPERFADNGDRHPFAFFPFGAGPRRCIGEAFARAEAKIVVGGLLRAFSFERETETFEMEASLTAVPDRTLELTAHARE